MLEEEGLRRKKEDDLKLETRAVELTKELKALRAAVKGKQTGGTMPVPRIRRRRTATGHNQPEAAKTPQRCSDSGKVNPLTAICDDNDTQSESGFSIISESVASSSGHTLFGQEEDNLKTRISKLNNAIYALQQKMLNSRNRDVHAALEKKIKALSTKLMEAKRRYRLISGTPRSGSSRCSTMSGLQTWVQMQPHKACDTLTHLAVPPNAVESDVSPSILHAQSQVAPASPVKSGACRGLAQFQAQDMTPTEATRGASPSRTETISDVIVFLFPDGQEVGEVMYPLCSLCS